MITIADLQSLPAEEQALLLDVGQFTLDVLGVFEPTPVADLTNAVVSLIRRDLAGALASCAGAIPYVGDFAKLGKAPGYLKSVERAVQLSRSNARFGTLARPLLEALYTVLDRLPTGRIPPVPRDAIERMRDVIADGLPGVWRAMSRLDRLTDELLRMVFGSTRNVGLSQRRNLRTVVEFLDRHAVEGGNLEKWADLIKGIDLHSAEAVRVERLRPGDLVAQYGQAGSDRIGQWLVKQQGAVSHRNLGVSGDVLGQAKARTVYRVKREVEVLRSKAAGAADFWTPSLTNQQHAIHRRDGAFVREPATQVAGGGEQYFMPQAWNFLEKLP